MNNTKKGIVNIHGKEYMTVARRLELAHEDNKVKGIKTEVLQFTPVVVVKATVTVDGIEYQGISSANPAKSIEKANPFEVAETSAVGRALGFAGYGLIESVATADDMTRATYKDEDGLVHESVQQEPVQQPINNVVTAHDNHICAIHNKPMKERIGKNGNWYDHRWQANGVWKQCNGRPKAQSNENVWENITYPALDHA